MHQEKNTIYSLKPSWSRLLDRVHTVGPARQVYTNTLATIVENGNYPRLISNATENSSFSLDEQQRWHTEKWVRGWAVVNEKMKEATVYFSGDDDLVFHQITLTPSSHWDCFQCILQTFSNEAEQECGLPDFKESLINKSLNPMVEEAAKVINREIIRGSKLRCVLHTAGGVVKRYHDVGGLMTKFGTMNLCSEKRQLSLNSRVIVDVDLNVKRSKFRGTFYDAKGRAQFFIEAA
ncbi:MAG: hypothetical protein ACSHX6_16240 [Akkermansiaceae bacterium]